MYVKIDDEMDETVLGIKETIEKNCFTGLGKFINIIDENDGMSFIDKPVVEKPRYCVVCHKKLSMYNPDNKCFCHPKSKEFS